MQMRQVISEPTRVTPNSQTLIDLICISNSLSDNVIKAGVQTAGLSDHSVIFSVIKGKYQTLSPKISKFRSFKNFDCDKFIDDISNIDWREFYSHDLDVEKCGVVLKLHLRKIAINMPL